MTAPRSPRQEKAYKKHHRTVDPTVCAFCVIDETSDQFVEGTNFFKIIKNIFPYSIWDQQDVVDHLMVVPYRHTDNLGSMATEEKVEYVDILEKYEKQGYNVYARAPVSVIKTVVHQHTHLIKTSGPPKTFILSVTKPLIRIAR